MHIKLTQLLVESVYEGYIKAKKTEPNRLAMIVADAVEMHLGDSGIKLTKFKPNWSNDIDEQGIKFEAKYSSYYQQDTNWYSYGTLEIDKSKYKGSDIKGMMQKIRSELSSRGK